MIILVQPHTKRLAKIFTAAKIPVSEGYGLTETSQVVSINFAHSKEKHYGFKT